MKTTNTEALLILINNLPEIEFAEILHGMSEQINREKWSHLIDKEFDIETFEGDLEDCRDDLDRMTDRKDALVDKINDAISLCAEFSVEKGDAEDMQAQIDDFIDKIKDKLQ